MPRRVGPIKVRQYSLEFKLERRRARRNGSAAKIVRVTAPGKPTNGRRRGPALFEREITASGGEREFAECW